MQKLKRQRDMVHDNVLFINKKRQAPFLTPKLATPHMRKTIIRTQLPTLPCIK